MSNVYAVEYGSCDTRGFKRCKMVTWYTRVILVQYGSRGSHVVEYESCGTRCVTWYKMVTWFKMVHVIQDGCTRYPTTTAYSRCPEKPLSESRRKQ